MSLSRNYLADLAILHEPASSQEIQAAEAALGFAFPEPYAELLRCSNGLEPRNPAFAIGLFGASELHSMAQAYEIPLNLPGFLFIGFDGGSRGILLSIHQSAAPLYIDTYRLFVPDGIRLVSESLVEWVQSGFTLIPG